MTPTQKIVRENLPHLYGWPWYSWAWRFFNSTNRINLLCAANQISKSSTQIRKCIDWATNTKKWPHLWPNSPFPRNIWYLYPDSKVATVEFESKWEPEFMPRGPFKDHPTYGWTVIYEKRRIEKIVFNTGVTVHFKTYMQNPSSLQSSTVHAIFCFVKGTEILTRDGLRCISTIKPGDMVMTHRGWRKVLNNHRREDCEVVTREFSNGNKITGTPDHPVWTLDGWVGLGQLTPEHVCYSVPEWKMSLIKNLFYLKTACTNGFLRVKTTVSGITSVLGTTVSCTLPFGNLEMANAPRGMSSTTKTTIPLTTGPSTYSSCQKRTTPHTTNSKSGRKKSSTILTARDAVSGLNPDRLSERSLGIVARIAGASAKLGDVLFAKLISWLAWTYKPSHVLTHADTKSHEEAVYNLDVEDAHTYLAQSLLVHNCDEELPENLYGELVFRLTAPMGHFHMVFTATLNQQLWWNAIEGRGQQEKFKSAFKQQISMYDCMEYKDGQPGPFDRARIQSIKESCNSDNEIQRRVYGKFIAESGRKYHAFNPSRHFVQPFDIAPGRYHIFGGVDPGSGGSAHPAGMGLVAVDPDYRKGYVITGRRMDNQETESSDILSAYIEMRGKHILRNQFYDQASADFNIVSSRAGESFCKSEKSHELGEDIINTLFRNDMLFIFDTEELRKLGQELMTVNKNTPKRKCKDDFIDGALRYPVTSIPWDWTAVRGIPLPKEPEERAYTQEEYDHWVEEQRRGPVDRARRQRNNPAKDSIGKEWEEETAFWNEQYGS